MAAADRISDLPESLLTHILSYLATKESVRTSVLSKRWESLWLNVPVLDLNCDDYPPYDEEDPEDSTCYIDRYLEFNKGSQMQKLKLKYNEDSDYDRVNFLDWIETMVDRGLQHLDVETVFMDSSCRDSMPKNIYKSKTLVFFKLTSVGLMDLDPDKLGVLLPCLKILYLEDILYDESDDDDDASVLEKLISGCPVLEELKLSFPHYHAEIQNLTFVRVRSKTLKSFDHWLSLMTIVKNLLLRLMHQNSRA